jgi:hypothetical protein
MRPPPSSNVNQSDSRTTNSGDCRLPEQRSDLLHIYIYHEVRLAQACCGCGCCLNNDAACDDAYLLPPVSAAAFYSAPGLQEGVCWWDRLSRETALASGAIPSERPAGAGSDVWYVVAVVAVDGCLRLSAAEAATQLELAIAGFG